MQRWISPPDFGKTTIGLTYGVGPCAGSIMSSSMSSFFQLWSHAERSPPHLCAAGITLWSTWSCTAGSFNFPMLLKTSGYFCCRIPPVVFGSAVTAAMPIPIFSMPRLVAVSFHRSGSPSPLIIQNLALAVLLPSETSQENVLITSSGVWDA